MANRKEVATADELMRRLKESGILGPTQLRRAEKLAAETPHHLSLARRLVAQRLVTRWQMGQLLVGWTRFRLGKYVLLSQIGRSNYGRLFRAAHGQLQREVAIQALSRRFAGHAEIVSQFLADARRVSALDHRNIVHIFDVDSGEDQYYMVMEYVRGVDLQQRVHDTGPLAVDEAINYLVQVIRGLAYAHQRDVIHRRLKPANLMIDEQGVVKIVGWGIGRLSHLLRSLDLQTEGPPDLSDSGYLAPEQTGIHDVSDARSDLYALGCTAHFLLTGQTPPAIVTPGPMAIPTDTAALRPDIPPGLAVVIRRLRAPDPEHRYASADEVVQDLLPCTESESDAEAVSSPATATAKGDESFDWTPPAPTPRPAAKSARSDGAAESSARAWVPHLSKRTLYVTASILLLMLLGAVGVWAYCMIRPGPTPSHSGASPRQTTLGRQPRLRRRDQQAAGEAWSKIPHHPSDAGNEALDLPPDAPPAGPADPVEGSQHGPAPAVQTAVPTDGDAPHASEPDAEPSPPDADGADATSSPTDAATPPAQPDAPPSQPESVTAAESQTSPWLDWPTAVELPPAAHEADGPAIDAPVDLATLAAPLPGPLAVMLLGGSTPGLRGTVFQLVPGAGTEPPSWQIVMTNDKANDAASRVMASLLLQDDRLQFRWDRSASEVAGVAHLGNCVLRLTSGAHTHDLRLRRPQVVDPLRVDLKKQSVILRVKVLAPPDPRQMRFQVTAVDEPLPSTVTFNPPTPIAVNAGRLQMSLGPDPDIQVLLLDITPELKAVFQLECEAFFRLKPDAEPVVLALRKLQLAELAVARNQELANSRALALRNEVISLGPNDPALGLRQEQLKKAEAELAECTKMTQGLAALAEIRAAVADGAAIQFRVFFLAEDCEVDLLRTEL